MATVNIAELKSQLSRYINLVRDGEVVIVRDRNVPVAKIVPLSTDDVDAEELELVAAGRMRLPLAPLPEEFWTMPRPRVEGSRIQRAIEDDREEA